MDNTLLWKEAKEFLELSYKELNKSEQHLQSRLAEVKEMIEQQGYYIHTTEELDYGAKLAWRNSNRCIGRLFWNSLTTFDERHLNTEEDIFKALLQHIEYATNEGRIRPTISIFHQNTPTKKVRLWNHQLIRYAGYRMEDGIIGDPHSLEFTEACIALGWEPKYRQFDLLPIVIQLDENPPKLFDIPQHLVMEVPLRHPQYEWFEDLELKWYAVPIIAEMSLDIGGLTYSAAPFNGWYMGTEIGARNLADDSRYNMLPKVASLMGADTKSNISLWKDRALVELNAAVLYSFKEDGVSIVDHHTAAHQFKLFEEKEAEANRQVTGNWVWLIPPVSPATTHIYHKPYNNEVKKPNYFYQKKPY